MDQGEADDLLRPFSILRAGRQAIRTTNECFVSGLAGTAVIALQAVFIKGRGQQWN